MPRLRNSTHWGSQGLYFLLRISNSYSYPESLELYVTSQGCQDLPTSLLNVPHVLAFYGSHPEDLELLLPSWGAAKITGIFFYFQMYKHLTATISKSSSLCSSLHSEDHKLFFYPKDHRYLLPSRRHKTPTSSPPMPFWNLQKDLQTLSQIYIYTGARIAMTNG